MRFMDWIIERFVDISTWFLELYIEARDWLWPMYYSAYLFYEISDLFFDLALDFSSFNNWLEWADEEIEDILSWSNIRSLIRGWLDGIEDMVDWFADWWENVIDAIGEWWEATLQDVKDLIASAVQGFDNLVEAWDTFWNITWPEWLDNFGELKSAWDNFWAVNFPTLVDFTWLGVWWDARLTDIQELINTAIQEIAPLMEGWQEVRETVGEFFSDPLEWLWGRFANWFLGPE